MEQSYALQHMSFILCQENDALHEAVQNASGDVVQLSPIAVSTMRRFQRLYFLNESQSISSFSTAEIGMTKWPSYKISVQMSAFDDRQALLEYEEAIEDADKVAKALDDEDTDGAMVGNVAEIEALG